MLTGPEFVLVPSDLEIKPIIADFWPHVPLTLITILMVASVATLRLPSTRTIRPCTLSFRSWLGVGIQPESVADRACIEVWLRVWFGCL